MAADKQQIIDLETRFWQAIKDKDASTAEAMIADQALVTGPFGTMQLTPAQFGKMMREAPWTLDTFKFEDVAVIFPTDDVAVIAYKVHQTGEMEGKPMDMHAADSTVWSRDGETWKSVLHSETILERERQPEPA